MKHHICDWGYAEKYSTPPDNWPRNIRLTSDKLQNVRITNLDFEEVIESVPDGSFLFLCPPYLNAEQGKFYVHSFSQDEHFRLC
ncbi:DNA adenine methylase [Nostoc sp.]|uniref:DNA adenine methylase n=1 Tax=Nostoc sp. TaxID=1180 RepID=UPI002FFC03B0